jgi:hypothetical protein
MSETAPELDMRSPETIHFADCMTYKAIFYYADDDNSNAFPGNKNECATASFSEGGSGNCLFSTGVNLEYVLDTLAPSA